MKQVTKSLQLDSQLHGKLKHYCDERGLKLQKLVENLIRDELSKNLQSNSKQSKS